MEIVCHFREIWKKDFFNLPKPNESSRYVIIKPWKTRKITFNWRVIRCLSCLFALYNQIDRFKNRAGLHTNAIYGFHLMLNHLLERVQPTHVLVAFDAGKTTFRTEMYKDYKAGRAKTPDEFREQLPYIREMLSALGITFYDLENYEADDIIGTLDKLAENEDEYDVTIVSGDKDLIQLADNNTTVEISKKVWQNLKNSPQPTSWKKWESPLNNSLTLKRSWGINQIISLALQKLAKNWS